MSDDPRTISSIQNAIESGAATPESVVSCCTQRGIASNESLNAFLQIFEESASGQEDNGALAGVPIAIKDNICTTQGRTTCASRILESYESPYDATVIRRLKDAGATIIGKTNLDEFAMGSSTEHSAFGPTGNPWDPTRSPGGSSGGSAAAVAARIVPVALGSDTGGSIRQPAALCGVVGVKPTYGRVSRYGLVAFASSLDQIGTFTLTVEDAAITLNVICGKDELDSTSASVPVPDFTTDLEKPIESLRLGIPTNLDSSGMHPSVEEAFVRAQEVYTELGAELVEIQLPHLEYGIAAYYIVATAEASSNLARYDGIRYGRRAKMHDGDDLEMLYARSRSEGFGHEVQRRIMLGTHALSSGYYDAYYNTALKTRRVIKRDFDAAFSDGVHCVLMPTTPEPAFKIGSKTDDPLALYLQDVFTVGANLAGLPAISIPSGFAQEDGMRLPVGVQLYAPAFDETTMFRAARMYERETGYGLEAPELHQ
ncbi:MAG: Asp-tRNA(Asn)/Glu-tRNA(Gln) amidotransferase subunit GatA [Planctomycetota bacterium]|jgi:aspartyl-tRNA(Asn)/glutamyl-tRNA(Gln) amidotransferase subunit A